MLLVLLFAFPGCERDDFQKLDQRNWQLVWSDEFNGAAGEQPDASKWTFDLGTDRMAGETRSCKAIPTIPKCINGW
jgi:hypothetical protein